MGLALALPSNSKTQLERVSKGKPSNLLSLVVSDKGKKFYNIDTWPYPQVFDETKSACQGETP